MASSSVCFCLFIFRFFLEVLFGLVCSFSFQEHFIFCFLPLASRKQILYSFWVLLQTNATCRLGWVEKLSLRGTNGQWMTSPDGAFLTCPSNLCLSRSRSSNIGLLLTMALAFAEQEPGLGRETITPFLEPTVRTCLRQPARFLCKWDALCGNNHVGIGWKWLCFFA